MKTKQRQVNSRTPQGWTHCSLLMLPSHPFCNFQQERAAGAGVSDPPQVAATCVGTRRGLPAPRRRPLQGAERPGARSLPAPGPHPFTAPPSLPSEFAASAALSIPQRPPPGINFEETGTSSPVIGSAPEPGRRSGRRQRRPRPLRAPDRSRGLAPGHAEKPVALGVPRRRRARPPTLAGRTNPRASSAVPEKRRRLIPGPSRAMGSTLGGRPRLWPRRTSREPRTRPAAPLGPPIPPTLPSAPTAQSTSRPPFSFRPPSVTDGEHGAPGGRSCAVRDSGQRREEQEAALRADGAKKDPRARRSRSYTISVST